MNYSFKAGWPCKPWTLLDDKIIIGNKEYTLTEITEVIEGITPKKASQTGCFHVRFRDGKSYMLGFRYDNLHSALEAKEHIEKNLKVRKEKESIELEAELRESLGEEADELIDWMNDTGSTTPKEIRMRCNVCGKIFCYTDADMKANESHLKWATAHAVGSLFGTRLDMYGQSNQMQAELDKVVDYSRCPNCKSTNLTDISNEEISEATQSPPVQTTAVSAADELKKFKELLDMDVITQEEFDAKKKQLLGL